MTSFDPSQRFFTPLESALKTSMIFFWVIFVIGVTSGWALAQMPHAPIGAILGLTIGIAAVGWCSVAFRRSLGSLADPAKDTISPKHQGP